MEHGQFLKLEEINQSIFNCTKCSFHKELIRIPYKPDFPIFIPDFEYCAMVTDMKDFKLLMNKILKFNDHNEMKWMEDLYPGHERNGKNVPVKIIAATITNQKPKQYSYPTLIFI